MIAWRPGPRVRAVAWVVVYLAGGLLLTALPFVLYLKYAAAPDSSAMGTTARGLLFQGLAQVTAFGLLTWLIGRKVLKLDWSELGWVTNARGRGFGGGMLLAAVLALGSMLLAVSAGARWLSDTGTAGSYLQSIGATTAVLAPAALAEELMFRGLPLVLLASAFGRGPAILVTSIVFGFFHALNPEVTALAIGNVALAGVFLSLAFYAPGGIWTAWGAHLGWNAMLAALDAPVSGLPFRIPLIDFDPGSVTWLTGGRFGPEGGLAATVVLCAGCVVLARFARKDNLA